MARKVPSEETRDRGGNDHLSAWTALNSETMERLNASAAQWSEQMTAISRGYMDFLQSRMADNMKFGRALITCPDLESLSVLQREWLEHFTSDYTKELTQLCNDCVTAAVECWQPAVSAAIAEKSRKPVAEPAAAVPTKRAA